MSCSDRGAHRFAVGQDPQEAALGITDAAESAEISRKFN